MYDAVHASKVGNFVVIIGDAHRNTAADLKLDFNDESSPTIGAEFLGTSITSGGDGNPAEVPTDTENPHIKFVNRQRGFQKVTVTPQTLRASTRCSTRSPPPAVRCRCGPPAPSRPDAVGWPRSTSELIAGAGD